MTNIFEPYCDTGLVTLKYPLLDHLVEDLKKFGSLQVLSAAPFEQYNHTIKKAYSYTSKRFRTRTLETVKVLNDNLKLQKINDQALQGFTPHESLPIGLENDGHCIRFSQFRAC